VKQILAPVLRTANDLTDAAKKITDEGISLFRSTLGNLPLLSSVRAIESDELEDKDETHYFLVPYRLSETGYALYTQRVLPQGTGPENKLPKARIFHLPAEGTVETLEDLLIEQLKQEKISTLDPSAPLADRLDMMADEIDNQSNLITGGLVVIGGVVAIVNPLLGVGIAAKAILPTIGSKLSKHGINHVSDWLRDKKIQASEKNATADAQKEIKRLPPEVKVDPSLALLEIALGTTDPAHDPNLEFASFMSSPKEATATALTAEAISCTYEPILKDKSSHKAAHLHPADIAWLKALADLTSHRQMT